MTVTITPNNSFSAVPGQPSLQAGTIVTDGSGVTPSTTASITTGTATTTAIGSTTGIINGIWMDLAGAGAGGISWRAKVKANVASTSVTFEGNAPTTVASAALTGCAYVHCGFRPRYIKVINLTTLASYEWVDGMEPNTMIQTTAAGAVSLVTGSAISTESQGFLLGAGILAVSSKFAFAAWA